MGRGVPDWVERRKVRLVKAEIRAGRLIFMQIFTA